MTLQIGNTAPHFSLPATDDKSYTYDALKGDKGTVILFWCNHCPYVQGSELRVIRLAGEFATQGVKFAAINANRADSYVEDDFPHMVERAKALGYNFTYLHDESQEVARVFGAQRTPEAFLFDVDGKLRYHGRIDDNPQDESAAKSHDLRNAIEVLLSGGNPDPAETGPIGCTIKWK
ncbi:MAG: thioredoxin family protein [bacterium]|nr:thioredoxin family protein [bacterium]